MAERPIEQLAPWTELFSRGDRGRDFFLALDAQGFVVTGARAGQGSVAVPAMHRFLQPPEA